MNQLGLLSKLISTSFVSLWHDAPHIAFANFDSSAPTNPS